MRNSEIVPLDQATPKAQDDAATLGTCRDEASLKATFRQVVGRYGFNAYAMGFLPDTNADPAPGEPIHAEPFLLLDWPVAWLELYARQGFASEDVVVAEAAATSEPFTWGEIRQRRSGASAHIFAAAARFGWSDGFVVPIHNPNAAPGARFAVASLAAPQLLDLGPIERAKLHRIALAAFARARTLRGRPADPKAALQLAPREREALGLVSQGLSDGEIAQRMGVKSATAHHHVESAKRRLNATTRAQAVAIAMSNGLIS